ncbi:MAG: hypothetical protein ACJ735_06900 [Actinomycetes bacterium]
MTELDQTEPDERADDAASEPPADEPREPKRTARHEPLYWRVLRLRHVRPTSWQRAVFFEGSLAVATVLVLADLASAWLLLVLPVAVALVVKGNDVLVGWLAPRAEVEPVEQAAASQPDMWAPVRDMQPTGTDEARVESDPEPEVALEPTEAAAPDSTPEAVPDSMPAAKPRPARSRPGAAAARAQVSAATGVRRRRPEAARDAEGSG